MTPMQALLVTHASRPFVEAKASLNALENRFSALDRLANFPPFNTLPSVHEAVPFSGMLTLWDIDNVAERTPVLIGEYDPGYKIQSAAFRGDQLLVLGEDRIEVLSPGFRLEKTIEDPWLVGGHTVYCDNRGFAYATSAPANAVLKIDIDAGKVVERIRMPDRYGIGYPLTENDDLRRHFVPTDRQPTHINSAVPCAEGLLVTLCVQGAVGIIGSTGQFREIIRGYRGCHGGRIEAATGLLYFTDSPAGIVWFADYKTGQIVSRIKVNSAWAHDADQVGENIFAVALSDHNRVEMVKQADGSVINTIDCHPFGASAMFVKAATLPDAWRTKLQDVPKGGKVSNAQQFSVGKELLSDPLNPVTWMGFASLPMSISSSLHINSDNVKYEYLAEGMTLTLPPGEYTLDAKLVCKAGEASVGIMDDAEVWIAQLLFDSSNSTRSTRFSIHAPSSVTVVIAGHNSRRACPVTAELEHLSLKRVIASSDQGADDVDESLVILQEAIHRRAEADILRAEIRKRDAMLVKLQQQLEARTVSRLIYFLKQGYLFISSGKRDTHQVVNDQLEASDEPDRQPLNMLDEIKLRDEMLRKKNEQYVQMHDHLQAEVNKRDQMLAELQEQLNERSRR